MRTLGSALSAKGGGVMRGRMALVLGLLGVLGSGCDEEGLQGYGLENRRNHPLKVTARRARGCKSQVDVSQREAFGAPSTRTLEPGDVVELSSFLYIGDADAGVGNPDPDPYPLSSPYGCGAIWISFPDHDYEAVWAWDESTHFWYYDANTWRFAVVVEGTEENVAVHVPAGVRELEEP